MNEAKSYSNKTCWWWKFGGSFSLEIDKDIHKEQEDFEYSSKNEMVFNMQDQILRN